MAITYTTKPTTRFLVVANGYWPAFGGYKKRGEYINVPEGTAISQVWTEVDDNGDPVPGGQVGKPVPRIITSSKPEEHKDKTLPEISELEAEGEADDVSAAPTPPAAAAKPAGGKKKGAAKPAGGKS